MHDNLILRIDIDDMRKVSLVPENNNIAPEKVNLNNVTYSKHVSPFSNQNFMPIISESTDDVKTQ